MRCPRCQAEVESGVEACPRCAAPLRLRDEPPGGPLDRPLDLDRRGDRRGEQAGPAPEAAPGDRPPLDETSPAAWRRPGDFVRKAIVAPPGHPRVPRHTPRFWALEEPGPSPVAQVAAPPRDPAPPPPEPGESDFEILGTLDPAPQPAPAPSPSPAAVELRFTVASGGQRVASWAVDALLAGSVAWLLVAGGALAVGARPAAEVVLVPVALLAALVHFAHASLGVALAGRTLGKWMLGLEVVGTDGGFPSPGRAALRAGLSLVSAGAAGLGLLLALVDRQGRGLHDRLTGTAVVRSP
jgi:uncharacterized RDD family membrane protein YckC